MTCTPSQSQHTSSDNQSQKDLPEMFLWQLNYYPNPIKNTNLLTINSFCFGLSRSLCCCICFFLSHAPRETGIAQKAAAVSPQKLQLTCDLDVPFPFVLFLDLPYPLLGIFLYCLLSQLLSPSWFSASSLSLSLWLFLVSWLLFLFSKHLGSWGFLSYPHSPELSESSLVLWQVPTTLQSVALGLSLLVSLLS